MIVQQKNIINFALNLDEFFRVSYHSVMKKMWDILKVTHEEAIEAERTRKHALIHKYGLFKMQQGEAIVDVILRSNDMLTISLFGKLRITS